MHRVPTSNGPNDSCALAFNGSCGTSRASVGHTRIQHPQPTQAELTISGGVSMASGG